MGIKKSKLTEVIQTTKSETAEAILTMLEPLNQGQRKKVLKEEKVKALCARYGVEVSE